MKKTLKINLGLIAFGSFFAGIIIEFGLMRKAEYSASIENSVASICMIVWLCSIVVSFVTLFLNQNSLSKIFAAIVLVVGIASFLIGMNVVLSNFANKRIPIFWYETVYYIIWFGVPVCVLGLYVFISKLGIRKVGIIISIIFVLNIFYTKIKLHNKYPITLRNYLKKYKRIDSSSAGEENKYRVKALDYAVKRYRDMGAYDRALSFRLESLKFTDDPREVFRLKTSLALIYYRLDENTKSIDILENILYAYEYEDDFGVLIRNALIRLIRCYKYYGVGNQGAGKFEKAYTRLVNEFPSAEHYYLFFRFYVDTHQRDKELDWIEKILKTYPNGSEADYARYRLKIAKMDRKYMRTERKERVNYLLSIYEAN